MMVDMTNVVSVLDRGGRGLIAKNDDPYLDDYGVRSKLLKYRKNKIADINNTITETNYEQLLAKYNKDNAETETTIKTLNDLLDPLDAKDAEIHQRFDQEEDMARNTLKAFQQWAAVHADLTKALKEDRQPNIRELASTVLEIKSEIENLKKH
jgi:ABC-type transporter Mla subunit MlaD